MRALSALLASSVILAAGCVGTDVGNPTDIDFTLYNESFQEIASEARAAPGDTIAVTAAWIAVERVRLRPSDDCSGGAEERLGPFVVDLLDDGPVPELSELDLPETEYCRFELRWDPLDGAPAAPAPPGLAEASIYVEGARGDETPFVLRSERNDELRLDAVAGSFAIDELTSALFVGFDAVRLFAGVDLDGAVVGGDGVIRIEPGTNDDALTTFDDNVTGAAELFDDDDGDGLLDAGERDLDDILAD